jgi:hypothetical protein
LPCFVRHLSRSAAAHLNVKASQDKRTKLSDSCYELGGQLYLRSVALVLPVSVVKLTVPNRRPRLHSIFSRSLAAIGHLIRQCRSGNVHYSLSPILTQRQQRPKSPDVSYPLLSCVSRYSFRSFFNRSDCSTHLPHCW